MTLILNRIARVIYETGRGINLHTYTLIYRDQKTLTIVLIKQETTKLTGAG